MVLGLLGEMTGFRIGAENVQDEHLIVQESKTTLKTKQNTMIGVYLKGDSNQLKEYSMELSCRSCLYIFEINCLSVASFAIIFSILKAVFSPCLEFPLLCRSF